jgi:hypothetical protein
MEGTLIESPDSPNVFWYYMNVVRVQFETFLDGDVEVYWDSGLVSLKGRLLKLSKKHAAFCHYTEDEMKRKLPSAIGFSVRRLTPNRQLGLPFYDDMMTVNVGEYVLYFKAVSIPQIRTNNYFLRMYRWMPGLRTCDQLLVRLQRAWRSKLSARRALALGMAFHGRLGRDAEVACLGADLYRLICGGL